MRTVCMSLFFHSGTTGVDRATGNSCWQLSRDLRVFNSDAPTLQLRTRDLNAVMAELWSRGIRQVFVEGGAALESSLISLGLADEYLSYLAPKLIGGPKTAVGDIEVESVDSAVNLRIVETGPLGKDLLIRSINGEA